MRMRDLGRLVCSFVLVGGAFLTAASCGGAGPSETSGGDASTDGASGLTFGQDATTSTDHCVPATCASRNFDCGDNADGCGGTLHCGSCTGTDFCGGGGFSKCGSTSLASDGAALKPCVAKTCADFPSDTCGQQSDGCGALTANCNATCPPGEFCGGGGSSTCGVGTLGGDAGDAGDAGVCVPKTCSDFATGTCGTQSDGCGNLTANCTTCASPTSCGGGGTPNVCGGNGGFGADGGMLQPCVPATCSTLAAGTCGIQGDGCGGTIGPCTTGTSPTFCGGGGPSLLRRRRGRG